MSGISSAWLDEALPTRKNFTTKELRGYLLRSVYHRVMCMTMSRYPFEEAGHVASD